MKRKIMQCLIVLTCFIVCMSSFMIYGSALTVDDFKPHIPLSDVYSYGNGYGSYVWVESFTSSRTSRNYVAFPDDAILAVSITTKDNSNTFTIKNVNPNTPNYLYRQWWEYWAEYSNKWYNPAGYPRFYKVSSASWNFLNLGFFYSNVPIQSWTKDGEPMDPADIPGQSLPPDARDSIMYGNMKYYVDGYRKHFSSGDRKIYVPLDKTILNEFTNGKMTYYTDTTGVFGGHVKFPIKFDLIQDNMRADDIIYFFENAIPHASWTIEGVKSDLVKGKEVTGWFSNKFSSAAFKFWRIENGFELLIPLGFTNLHGHKFDISFEIDGTLYNNKDWAFTFYTGYVDENEDGIDDRTQEKDEEGNIISDGSGVPNLTPGFIDGLVGDISGGSTFDGFTEIISSVKNFFNSVWGILPPEINGLILTAITIMISIAVLKVVF